MQTVKVRLRKPTRIYTFKCKDIELKRDDRCIVKSERGLEYGTCILTPEACSEEVAERYNMEVVRKATLSDESNFSQLEVEERKALDVCAMKIQQHSLPMKLVDAEYTFDKHKIVIYFTAADRVDFRKLVRDLAQELKTRIELRHIQVRDEAKIVGGIGVCGRELCCATWMPNFKPISMKMAKRQNLSLNPSKISGQCGRLLCCLGYENDQYPSKRSKAAAENEAARRMAELAAEEEDLDVQDDEGAEAGLEDDENTNGASDEQSRQEPRERPSGERTRPRRKRRRKKGKGAPQQGGDAGGPAPE